MSKKPSILIIDNGQYTYAAKALSDYFDVIYFNLWQSPAPFISAEELGTGIKGVKKVLEWQPYKNKVDLVLFTGLYFRGEANDLIEDGIKIWNSGNMEAFERDRGLFLDTLEDAGLPVPKTERCQGLSALKKEIGDRKEVWVKVSEYRGLTETFKHPDKRFSEAKFNYLERVFGIHKEKPMFFVQDPIKGFEYGLDTIVVNCELNENCLVGVEGKDSFWFGAFDKFENIPNPLKDCHTKFLNEVKKTDAKNYTGNLSTEVRVTDDNTHYFVDITLRLPMPPSASMFYVFENLPEVILESTKGKNVPLKSRFKYVMECVITTDITDCANAIYFDDKFKEQIFLSGYSVQEGFTYKEPPEQLYGYAQYVGSVVGGGNTMQEAYDKLKEVCDNISENNTNNIDFRMPQMKDILDTIVEIEKKTGYVF
jgi:hypothetical protein